MVNVQEQCDHMTSKDKPGHPIGSQNRDKTEKVVFLTRIHHPNARLFKLIDKGIGNDNK